MSASTQIPRWVFFVALTLLAALDFQCAYACHSSARRVQTFERDQDAQVIDASWFYW